MSKFLFPYEGDQYLNLHLPHLEIASNILRDALMRSSTPHSAGFVMATGPIGTGVYTFLQRISKEEGSMLLESPVSYVDVFNAIDAGVDGVLCIEIKGEYSTEQVQQLKNAILFARQNGIPVCLGLHGVIPLGLDMHPLTGSFGPANLKIVMRGADSDSLNISFSEALLSHPALRSLEGGLTSRLKRKVELSIARYVLLPIRDWVVRKELTSIITSKVA